MRLLANVLFQESITCQSYQVKTKNRSIYFLIMSFFKLRIKQNKKDIDIDEIYPWKKGIANDFFLKFF